MYHQLSLAAYQFGEDGKTLKISLLSAVYVKVIGISGGDNGNVGRQMMKRTVILIGLNHSVWRRVAQQQIAVIIAQDATQKRITPHGAIVKYVSRH